MSESDILFAFILIVSAWVVLTILKLVLTPPCKHCKHHRLYDYHDCCFMAENKISGGPRRCEYVRGGLKCWFKRKDRR